MEIHAPEHAIRTLKDALTHVAIVTVGIVIALSFEGVLEWSHHRALVREARENLQNEIRNNQKDIRLVLNSIEVAKNRFIRAVELTGDASSTPEKQKELEALFNPSSASALTTGLTIASLNTASYTTAQVSGAFALMDYSEIRKYAEIYEPQAFFTRAQDTAEKDATAAAMLGQTLLMSPTAAELQDVKRQLRLALGGLLEMGRYARVLNDRYAAALRDSE